MHKVYIGGALVFSLVAGTTLVHCMEEDEAQPAPLYNWGYEEQEERNKILSIVQQEVPLMIKDELKSLDVHQVALLKHKLGVQQSPVSSRREVPVFQGFVKQADYDQQVRAMEEGRDHLSARLSALEFQLTELQTKNAELLQQKVEIGNVYKRCLGYGLSGLMGYLLYYGYLS